MPPARVSSPPHRTVNRTCRFRCRLSCVVAPSRQNSDRAETSRQIGLKCEGLDPCGAMNRQACLCQARHDQSVNGEQNFIHNLIWRLIVNNCDSLPYLCEVCISACRVTWCPNQLQGAANCQAVETINKFSLHSENTTQVTSLTKSDTGFVVRPSKPCVNEYKSCSTRLLLASKNVKRAFSNSSGCVSISSGFQ